MRVIEAVLVEPVGCLAEFAQQDFADIAAQVFHRSDGPIVSGSAAYWRLLDAMAANPAAGDGSAQVMIERGEIEAVDRASLYEDVVPSLSELQAMGLQLIVASSLSAAAVSRFLEAHALSEFFSDVWTRDTAGGVIDVPLVRALEQRTLDPTRVMFITDTAAGVHTAKRVGVNAILMMNDPDEAMRLTELDPAGGIVSLHELPDFVRLVLTENGQPAWERREGERRI
jgi:beta-phosphoglucomutase-like phosphatase (HAD superfamily)